MDFDNFLEPILYSFYVLGQSPFLLNIKQPLKHKLFSTPTFFKILQAVIALFLSFSCIDILNFREKYKYDITEVIIINFVILCDIVRISFILFQCIYYKNHAIDIICTLRKLATYYAIHLKHYVIYKKFTKQFIIKAIIILGVFIPDLVIIIRLMVIQEISPILIQIKVLQLFRATSTLYAIFYVDLLNFFLTEFDLIANRDGNQMQLMSNIFFVRKRLSNDVMVRRQLRHFKNIHFLLWETVQQINIFLGCLPILFTHFSGLCNKCKCHG